MEPSSIQALASAARRHARSPVRMRLRSDEQLIRSFRAGNEDAFRAIHDRYRTQLFAYARQMLAGDRQDAEEALQDVFVRAHSGLRSHDRAVSLRAWLYRIMHNRCIDQIRRPLPPSPDTIELLRPPANDPLAIVEQRESLRLLVADVRRLPEQQRSALLMREIGGMSYDEVGVALGLTLPAVKSTLTRARAALTVATEARDTACFEIREQLTATFDRGIRFNGLVRRHLHDCELCTAYHHELRATRKRFAALTPAFGPGALLAKLFGAGALLGGGAGGAAALSGGSVGGAGAALGAGAFALTTGQLAALVAATAIGTGGIAELHHAGSSAHHHRHHRAATTTLAAAASGGAGHAVLHDVPEQLATAAPPSSGKRSTRNGSLQIPSLAAVASAVLPTAGAVHLILLPDGSVTMLERGAQRGHDPLEIETTRWLYGTPTGHRELVRLLRTSRSSRHLEVTLVVGSDGRVTVPKGGGAPVSTKHGSWHRSTRGSQFYSAIMRQARGGSWAKHHSHPIPDSASPPRVAPAPSAPATTTVPAPTPTAPAPAAPTTTPAAAATPPTPAPPATTTAPQTPPTS